MYYSVYLTMIKVNSFSKLIKVTIWSGAIRSLFFTIIRIVLNSVLQVLTHHFIVTLDKRVWELFNCAHYLIYLCLRETRAH